MCCSWIIGLVLHFDYINLTVFPLLILTLTSGKPSFLKTRWNMAEAFLSFLVPREHVKTVKSALERACHLNRAIKIHPSADERNSNPRNGKWFVVPSTLPAPGHEKTQNKMSVEYKAQLLRDLGLEEQLDSISITTYSTPTSQPLSRPPSGNMLLAALSTWLHALPAALLPSLDLTPAALLSAFPSTYSLYKPLLLLPAHTFRSPAWTALLSALPLQPPPSLLTSLYATLAHAAGATHVALNAPIPPQRASFAAEEEGRNTNVLRAPLALVPLHGDFGGRPTAAVADEGSSGAGPMPEDFAAAFWVSARQNGVVQVWAPLYTMFSRGNVSEKARVLGMESVRRAVREGEGEGEWGGAVGCAAVDLYAGIGYFAFSYRKAGVRRVLCWELNPWSVEGLTRGAAENGWSVESFGAVGGGLRSEEGEKGVEEDFWVFEESNEFALEKILRLRNSLPPIRHVNCGLLPTSRGSWKTAVEAVDPAMGGWIHLHENIAVKDIEAKAEDIVREIQAIVDDEPQGSVSQGSQKERQVELEHVEKVKTYAPGVMHCVLDIYIPRKDVRVRDI